MPDAYTQKARTAVFFIFSSIVFLFYLEDGIGVLGLWDDAFMFLRYARNWLDGYPFAWNPGGSSVDGATSPLWLLICVGLTALADFLQVASTITLKWAGIVVAVFWMICVYRMSRRAFPGASRYWPCLLVTIFAVLDTKIHYFAQSGMETLMAGALVALTLFFFLRLEQLQARKESEGRYIRAALPAGIFAVMCVLTRPELAVFAALAPVLLAWKHRREQVRPYLYILLVVGIGGVITVCTKLALFGSIMPLPAYVKGSLWTSPYEDYSVVKQLEFQGWFFQFIREYCFFIVVLAGVLSVRTLRRAFAWVWIPLLLLIGYNLITLPVMGYGLRFYQPLMPLCILLFWGSMSYIEPYLRSFLNRKRIPLLALITLLSVGLMGSLWNVHLWRMEHPKGKSRSIYTRDDPKLEIAHFLAASVDGMKIAATEVGFLGYTNPTASIIDLSGLNDPEFCRGFNADSLFKRCPDTICLVHPDYGGITRRIIGHPEFAHFRPVYFYNNPERLDLLLNVYVDTRSPHYKTLARNRGTKKQ